MKKAPTYEEAEEDLGPEAMSFFMDMLCQDDREEDEEKDVPFEPKPHEIPVVGLSPRKSA